MILTLLALLIQTAWSACYDPALPITKNLVRYPPGDLWCKAHAIGNANSVAYLTKNETPAQTCDEPSLPDLVWAAGCEKALLNRDDAGQLKNCFQSLRAKMFTQALKEEGMRDRLRLVPRFLKFGCDYYLKEDVTTGPVDCLEIDELREALLRSLSRDFNPIEEEFLGTIFTLYGEARTVGRERVREMQGIMKVMENRSIVSGGNLLDVALEPKQFSSFNSDERNWAMTLLGSYQNYVGYDDAIQAYLSYPMAKFSCSDNLGEEDCNARLKGMLNYHARWMSRSDVHWASTVSPIEFQVDGVKLSQTATTKVNPLFDSHFFYQGSGQYRPSKNPYR